MTDYLTRIFDHLAWADERVLAGLRASPGSDPRAMELYCHVVGSEHNWLARLHERAPHTAIWPELTLDEAAELGAENVAGFRAIIEQLQPAELARSIPYRNSAGKSFHSTVQDILLHVALHGSYHRGQVALVVRGAGGEPVPSDYIAFARGVPAATR